MTATVDVLTDIGGGLVAALEAVGQLARVYGYPPRELDELPAVAIALPAVSRPETRTDEGEFGGHLGVDVWELEWPIALYVRHDDPAYAQEEALELMGLLVDAVDDAYRLNLNGQPTVNEAKLVALEAEYLEDSLNRQMIVVHGRVDMYALIPR